MAISNANGLVYKSSTTKHRIQFGSGLSIVDHRRIDFVSAVQMVCGCEEAPPRLVVVVLVKP
jgi:hypothetical protein